jgi:hypothetical protein
MKTPEGSCLKGLVTCPMQCVEDQGEVLLGKGEYANLSAPSAVIVPTVDVPPTRPRAAIKVRSSRIKPIGEQMSLLHAINKVSM